MAVAQGKRAEGRSVARDRALLVVALVGVTFVFVVLALEFGYQPARQGDGTSTSQTTQTTCGSLQSPTGAAEHVASGGTGNSSYFLVVEADPPSPYAGINGSYYVPPTTQWPTINVKLGQVVHIHVINCASSESHGFQINYYYDISKNLVSIPPGGSYDISFTANKAGTFRIYCGILCSIHPLMQNGALVVS